jgi:hypothetical protein
MRSSRSASLQRERRVQMLALDSLTIRKRPNLQTHAAKKVARRREPAHPTVPDPSGTLAHGKPEALPAVVATHSLEQRDSTISNPRSCADTNRKYHPTRRCQCKAPTPPPARTPPPTGCRHVSGGQNGRPFEDATRNGISQAKLRLPLRIESAVQRVNPRGGVIPPNRANPAQNPYFVSPPVSAGGKIRSVVDRYVGNPR